jgi:hypothetical protein
MRPGEPPREFPELRFLAGFGDDVQVLPPDQGGEAVEGLLEKRFFPMMFRNCLDFDSRLRGQKRVPDPPAMITAYKSDLRSMPEPEKTTFGVLGRKPPGEPGSGFLDCSPRGPE